MNLDDVEMGLAYVVAAPKEKQRGDMYRRRALALLAQVRKYDQLMDLGGYMAASVTMQLEAAQAALADAIQDNTQNCILAEAAAARADKLAALLAECAECIKHMHSLIEDELTTEQAIAHDPMLTRIAAALGDAREQEPK